MFAGEGAGPLVEAILAQPCLDGGLASKGEAVLGAFANGEVRVQLKSNVRGLRVVIVATCSSTAAEGRTLNDLEAQAQLMVQAARESDASEILLVYPTLPYARSEKKTAAREPIAAARTVKVAFALGATRILAIDLHAAAVQGFASPHPLDNLYAAQLLQEAIAEEMLARLDGHASTSATTRPPRWILVSPDVGGEKRIEVSDLQCSPRCLACGGITDPLGPPARIRVPPFPHAIRCTPPPSPAAASPTPRSCSCASLWVRSTATTRA